MIAGVDDAVKVGTYVLDASDGAPKHPLAAAAVVGVGVEESHRLLSVLSAGEYLQRDSKD